MDDLEILGIFKDEDKEEGDGITDSLSRLADKQAKPCLLAYLLVLAVSKQASKRPYFGQSSKQWKGLLACLLVYCLYIVNLVVAVVGNRPLVFFWWLR